MPNPNSSFAVFIYECGHSVSVTSWVYRHMLYKGRRPIIANLWNCCDEVVDRVSTSMHPKMRIVINNGVY